MAPAQSIKARPYRYLITAAFHRHFFDAVLLTGALCGVEAILLSTVDGIIWTLFSIVVRTLLIYIPTFIIFFFRLNQRKFSERATRSGLDTVIYLAQRYESYEVLIGYAFSAWIFSEIFIASASEDSGLSWVTEGQIYEKLRLNERVIYLRSHAFIVAFTQSWIHLKNDYSVVRLPAPQTLLGIEKRGQVSAESDEQVATFEQVKRRITWTGISCFALAVLLMVTGPVLYLPMRPFAWNVSLSLARNVLRWNIPEYSEYDTIPPFHYTILARTLLQGFLLFMLWETCNQVFNIYTAQEPVRNDHTLTDDFRKTAADAAKDSVLNQSATKDPNGSLLNGLQAKNPKWKSFAIWELDIIARRFKARRQSLLTELDRKDGSAWSQALTVCLGLVDGVTERINPKKHPAVDMSKEVQHLPKIASPIKANEKITAESKPKNLLEGAVTYAGDFGKSLGSQPAHQPRVIPALEHLVGKARDDYLSKEQQKLLSKAQMESVFRSYAVRLLKMDIWLPKSPITGRFQPFKFLHRTYAREIKSKVFGSPRSDFFLVVRAVDAISALVAASLEEDTYGIVSKSIPEIFRSFVKAVTTIQALEEQTTPHWTDVNFGPATKKDPEVAKLANHLKEGIKILLLNFGHVVGELGLTAADVEAAKKTQKT